MLWVLHFLSVRYRLHSASLIFPEFQRVDSNNCKSGKGENTETGETFKWWYSLETGSYILLKEICIKMSFEFFNRTGATTQVEDGNFRLNTRFLEHSSFAFPPANQKKKKSHKPCSPHSKYCLLFLGTSDDHPGRSPVWLLSISSLRGTNSFKLNCCYYKSKCWFQI